MAGAEESLGDRLERLENMMARVMSLMEVAEGRAAAPNMVPGAGAERHTEGHEGGAERRREVEGTGAERRVMDLDGGAERRSESSGGWSAVGGVLESGEPSTDGALGVGPHRDGGPSAPTLGAGLLRADGGTRAGGGMRSAEQPPGSGVVAGTPAARTSGEPAAGERDPSGAALPPHRTNVPSLRSAGGTGAGRAGGEPGQPEGSPVAGGTSSPVRHAGGTSSSGPQHRPGDARLEAPDEPGSIARNRRPAHPWAGGREGGAERRGQAVPRAVPDGDVIDAERRAVGGAERRSQSGARVVPDWEAIDAERRAAEPGLIGRRPPGDPMSVLYHRGRIVDLQSMPPHERPSDAEEMIQYHQRCIFELRAMGLADDNSRPLRTPPHTIFADGSDRQEGGTAWEAGDLTRRLRADLGIPATRAPEAQDESRLFPTSPAALWPSEEVQAADDKAKQAREGFKGLPDEFHGLDTDQADPYAQVRQAACAWLIRARTYAARIRKEVSPKVSDMFLIGRLAVQLKGGALTWFNEMEGEATQDLEAFAAAFVTEFFNPVDHLQSLKTTFRRIKMRNIQGVHKLTSYLLKFRQERENAQLLVRPGATDRQKLEDIIRDALVDGLDEECVKELDRRGRDRNMAVSAWKSQTYDRLVGELNQFRGAHAAALKPQLMRTPAAARVHAATADDEALLTAVKAGRRFGEADAEGKVELKCNACQHRWRAVPVGEQKCPSCGRQFYIRPRPGAGLNAMEVDQLSVESYGADSEEAGADAIADD